MTVEQRIRRCILIEKMHENKDYSEKLSLEDISKFHGRQISRKEGKKTC